MFIYFFGGAVTPFLFSQISNLTLDNQEFNYNFNSSEYYVRGDSNIISFYANFDSDDYLECNDYIYYDLSVDYTWSDWFSYNGKNTICDLKIDINGTGFIILEITNNVNDDIVYVFVDNLDYTKK